MESLRIAEITKQECEADETLCFMSMPIWKFIVLNLLTFGLYSIVWYYKCWCTVRDNYKIKLNAFARTFFLIFTCYGLFKIINKHFQKFFMSISPVLLTIMIIVGNFASYSKDAMGNVMCLLFFIPSIIIQSKINQINKTHFPQAENSVWTWKTTGYVALYWFILIVGIFIYTILTYAE